jgi:hypothetical protein
LTGSSASGIATVDSSTSPACRPRSGISYTTSTCPIPSAHTYAPALRESAAYSSPLSIGWRLCASTSRPTKRWATRCTLCTAWCSHTSRCMRALFWLDAVRRRTVVISATPIISKSCVFVGERRNQLRTYLRNPVTEIVLISATLVHHEDCYLVPAKKRRIRVSISQGIQ